MYYIDIRFNGTEEKSVMRSASFTQSVGVLGLNLNTGHTCTQIKKNTRLSNYRHKIDFSF